MFAVSRLVPFVLLVTVSLAAQIPTEPHGAVDLLLAGRLLWGASALPSGEILAPAEDQSLSVISDRELARWSAGSRFSAPATVAPQRSLIALPQISGRIDVLEWDARTNVLSQRFAAVRTVAATSSAWATSGAVTFAWRDGEIESWSPQGDVLWSASARFEVRFLLVDESLGIYAFGPNQVALFNPHGKLTATWPLGGTPRGVAQSTAGEVYCWTDQGLFKKGYDSGAFLKIGTAILLGMVIDRQDQLVVSQADGLRRLGSDGTLLSEIRLARPPLTPPAIDDRGRILVGTSAGLEVWTYDGRLLAVLGRSPVSGTPLLTDGGLAAWSSNDWRIHVAPGFKLPLYGWPQDGGRGRSFTARRPDSVAVRRAAWDDNPEFSYLFQLAASGEEAKQRQVLERFEAQAARGSLLETWPYANLILLKIARSGLTDLLLERNRVLNNWPSLRSRAYALLAASAGPEDREELLDLLHHEYDSAAASQGVRALAKSGWDGDGKLMRLLVELQGRMPESSTADAVLEAARTLWQTNGQSTDPALIPLVSSLFQGPYPRVLKQKAQKFFQDLVASD